MQIDKLEFSKSKKRDKKLMVLGQLCHFQPPQVHSGTVMPIPQSLLEFMAGSGIESSFQTQFWNSDVIFDLLEPAYWFPGMNLL